MTVRLRIDLAYEGGPYAGYARQPGQTTVQGVIEDALAVLTDQRVTSFVAGRTDRGVHASAQVIHVDLDWERARLAGRGVVTSSPGPAALAALGAALDVATPDSIRIHAVRRVADTFHARFTATSRTYRFRLRDGVDPRSPRGVDGDPIDVWGVLGPLDVPAMRAGGRHLVGEHDFAAFCRRAPGRTTVRRIHALTVRRVALEGEGRIDVRVHGTAFCHQQVRAIVGCLVEVGRSKRPPGWIAEVLAARDRSLAAPVAPPHGLTLERVTYGRGHPAALPRPVGRASPAGGRPGPG